MTMNKKRYIKPETEVLLDTGMFLLSQSKEGPGGNDWNSRKDSDFTEDDDDYDELFQVFYSEGIGVMPHTAQPHRGTDPL